MSNDLGAPVEVKIESSTFILQRVREGGVRFTWKKWFIRISITFLRKEHPIAEAAAQKFLQALALESNS